MTALPPRKQKTAEERANAARALRGQWALTEPAWVKRTRGLTRPDPASVKHRNGCEEPDSAPLLVKVVGNAPDYADLVAIFACSCGAQVTVHVPASRR